MTPLLSLELSLFERINHLRSPTLDQLAALFSSSIWPGTIAIGLVLYALSRGHREGRATALALAVAFVGAHFISGGLKDMIQRPAPRDVIVGARSVGASGKLTTLEKPLKAPRKEACPSTEAATIAVAVAVLSSQLFKWWFLLLPLLAGWAQVYAASHRPGDVLLGWLLGAGIAWLVHQIRSGGRRRRRDLQEYQAHLARRR